jgi:hypothetical protein
MGAPLMPKINYESMWYDEIAERWTNDFIVNGHSFDEVNAYTEETDSDSDEPADNLVFEIEFDGESINLFAFCDRATREIVDIESLDQQNVDAAALAKHIYEIDQRWQKELVMRILKKP